MRALRSHLMDAFEATIVNDARCREARDDKAADAADAAAEDTADETADDAGPDILCL